MQTAKEIIQEAKLRAKKDNKFESIDCEFAMLAGILESKLEIMEIQYNEIIEQMKRGRRK